MNSEESPDWDREQHGAMLPARLPEPLAAKRAAGSQKSFGAADLGSAHHRFLQLVALDRTGTAAELSREARRLEQQGRLSSQEVAALDFEAIARFWTSELGRRILARPHLVHRELAFTARFSPDELASLLGQASDPSLQSELVLAQGVVDLAVVAPEAVWLVDFKTDQFEARASGQLAARITEYSPQLGLYSAALERIYRRPVAECWLYFLRLNLAVPIV